MKKHLLFAVVLAIAGTLNAEDLIMEEYFEAGAGEPLIADTITKSDNFNPVTGWSSVANSGSGLTCFYIQDTVLTYEGYAGSGQGHTLAFRPNKMAGQSVFKNFDKGIKNDSTIYIAFMIQFLKDTQDYESPDYFMGIKIEPAATSTNYTGRIYATVQSQSESGESYEGEEITMTILKASNGESVSDQSNYLTFDQTYLMVFKYHVGVLNGKTADEEAGHYDDEMWLYVNPSMDREPETANIYSFDPNGRDGYRISGSGKEMGSLRGFYLRGGEPGKANRINPYLLGGVRIGFTWEDVMGPQEPKEGLADAESAVSTAKMIRDGQLLILRNGKEYSAQGSQLK